MKYVFETDDPDEARILMDANNLHSVLFNIVYNLYRDCDNGVYKNKGIIEDDLESISKILSVITEEVERKNIILE